MQALPFNEGLDAEAVVARVAQAKLPMAISAADSGDEASHGSEHSETAGDGTLQNTGTAAAAERGTPEVAEEGGGANDAGVGSTEVPDAEEDEEEEDNDGDKEAARAARLAAELAEVAALTGQPVEEDTLLYAVPMAAPYDALNKCKFKVKLTPGGQKKGKAARQALELLTRKAGCTARCAPS